MTVIFRFAMCFWCLHMYLCIISMNICKAPPFIPFLLLWSFYFLFIFFVGDVEPHTHISLFESFIQVLYFSLFFALLFYLGFCFLDFHKISHGYYTCEVANDKNFILAISRSYSHAKHWGIFVLANYLKKRIMFFLSNISDICQCYFIFYECDT